MTSNDFIAFTKKIGLRVGIRGLNVAKKSKLNSLVIPDGSFNYFKKFAGKRYERHRRILTEISARSWTGNGDTRLTNNLAKAMLKDLGSISDRQICNIIKHLEAHKQISVEIKREIIRIKDTDGNLRTKYRTAPNGRGYPCYRTIRMVRVWSVLAFKNFKVIPKGHLVSKDIRPNSFKMIQSVPAKYRTRSEYRITQGNRSTVVKPHFTDLWGAVKVGIINGRIYDRYQELEDLRSLGDAYAIMVLGHPLAKRRGIMARQKEQT